mgnify:CR=1 FL=1
MNERINELRLDAGLSRLHEVPYMVAVNKEGEIIEPLEGLQKFAELIVRECIDTLDFHGFEDAIPYVKWMATNKLGQHFGIE